MRKGRKPKMVAVGAITASIPEHAQRYGVKYGTVLDRLRRKWTLEQALGIERRKRPDTANMCGRKLEDGPRLGSKLANLLAAISGEATAEEYLRREGVPQNGYTLGFR